MIKINDRVPDVELHVYQNEQFRKVKLSEYKGMWVVLFFYPLDFTFVCPTELSETWRTSTIKTQGAEVFSVSTDTVFTHKAWHDKPPTVKKIKFPMAADPTGSLSRMFGTYIDAEGLALRGSLS